MKKINKLGELAWVFGVLIISLGVFFTTKGGFGVSMIVAPAYSIHLALKNFFPWYSFGTSEYILQGALLILMCIIIRKFNPRYLLSFLTAVIYGYILDFWFFLFGSEPFATLPGRIVSLAAGVILTGLAVALFFRTYLPKQVYELFVSEVSKKYSFKTEKFKLVYDMSSLAIAIVLAFIVSKRFDSVKFTDCIGIGTLVCTAFTALSVSLFGKVLDKFFGFEPGIKKLEAVLKY